LCVAGPARWGRRFLQLDAEDQVTATLEAARKADAAIDQDTYLKCRPEAGVRQ